MSSLQRKIDESETKYEETSKLSEERVKQEVPVFDQGVIIQLEAENQQLKVVFLDIDFLYTIQIRGKRGSCEFADDFGWTLQA